MVNLTWIPSLRRVLCPSACPAGDVRVVNWDAVERRSHDPVVEHRCVRDVHQCLARVGESLTREVEFYGVPTERVFSLFSASCIAATRDIATC